MDFDKNSLARDSQRFIANRKSKLDILGILFLIFIIVVVIGYTVNESVNHPNGTALPSSWKQQDESTMAYIMAEDYVKASLKSPSTADFPSHTDKVIRYGNSQKYMVTSWVDSQNSFGAMLRTNFVCEVEQIYDGRWQLNSLTFAPR